MMTDCIIIVAKIPNRASGSFCNGNGDQHWETIRVFEHFARMPRYYFDLHNDIDALDPEGIDLPGIDEAKSHALLEAREMIEESTSKGHINLNHFIQIRDEGGQILHRLHFDEAIQIIPRAQVR
jgi:hypothetical protein